MASVWQRLRSWFPTAGASGGGAGGGFHLWWKGVPANEPIVACSVVLEVVQPPTVAALYFWALQASFLDATGQSYGAAHTGLQWNPRHPGSRAVNWGGYAQAADVTSILEGSDSPLPGIPGDRNTRTFAWRDAIPYRFTIHRGTVGGWTTSSTIEQAMIGSFAGTPFHQRWKPPPAPPPGAPAVGSQDRSRCQTDAISPSGRRQAVRADRPRRPC